MSPLQAIKRLFRTTRSKFIALAAVAAIAIIAIATLHKAGVFRPLLNADRAFDQQPIATTYQLYDVGIADINDDSWLDIFTANHNIRQLLLINQQSNQFIDQLLPAGLSQNNTFPGIEPSDIAPDMQSQGLYIYWEKAALIVRARGTGSSTIAGEIDLADWVEPSSVILQPEGKFEAIASESQNRSTIHFSTTGEGQLVIRSRQYEIVDSVFNLDPQLPLDRIYIGTERLHPSSHRFEIVPGKDRHGLAWADYGSDRQLDVFIVRGGGAGTMRPDEPANTDELLIQNNLSFQDRTNAANILKNACPARQVASIDANQDGQLDLYVVCGRGKPPNATFPNQLYQQNEGRFTEVAAEKGLDIPEKGAFTWLDVELDGDMDFLWASDSEEIWLYANRNGQFEPQLIGKNQGAVKQLTVADFDTDGDFDVFIASSNQSALLVNQAGTLSASAPESIGLPTRAYTANWVDYDNDGLADLHVLPSGLYQQTADHQFKATQLLEINAFKLRNHKKFYAAWFDANNDGFRDLLAAIENRPYAWIPSKVRNLWTRFFPPRDIFRLEQWNLSLYPNKEVKNHWLQLQLVGRAGNRQAIGARVEVTTSDGTQLEQVNQAEGSVFSQGHYRLYFGLGQRDRANSVKVFWPNGDIQEIAQVKGDRLLKIEQAA